MVTTSWGSVSSDLNLGSVNVYPNPNNGSFTIGLNGWEGNSQIMLRMTDAQGREVFNNTGEELIGEKKVMNLQGLAKGIYNLEVAGDHGRVIKKIVVTQ